MVRTAPFGLSKVQLLYLFMHCINEGSLSDRLLLLDFVITVTKTIFFHFFTKRRLTKPCKMFYQVIVYRIVEFI